MPEVYTPYWSHGGTSSTSTSASTWLDWNTLSTTSTSCSTGSSATWRVWTGPNQVAVSRSESYAAIPKITEEQRAENERRLREHVRQQKTIQQRATKLLLQNLNREQQREYVRTKQFKITLSNGNVYLLQRVWSGNVYRLNEQNLATCRYCLHFKTTIPYEDLLLAQKLLLESNEAEFLQRANKTEFQSPRPPDRFR